MANSFKILGLIFCWAFGILVFGVGLINLFWGNDPGFGSFLLLLSLAYFPPVGSLIYKKFGWRIPLLLKVVLAVFVLWAALGVGELGAKIEMMKRDW